MSLNFISGIKHKILVKDEKVSEIEADYIVSILVNIIPSAVNVRYLYGRKEVQSRYTSR